LLLDRGHGSRGRVLLRGARPAPRPPERRRVGRVRRRSDPGGAPRRPRGRARSDRGRDRGVRGRRPRRRDDRLEGQGRRLRPTHRRGGGLRSLRVVPRPGREHAPADRVPERNVTGRRVAVVGAGMTRFVRRAQETGKELAWEASRAALDSCELSLADVDAVCCGTAPDAFDGVHMKGEYLSDGCGAVGKPFIRTYVGGGTGVFVGIQGWYTVASGAFDVALVV